MRQFLSILAAEFRKNRHAGILWTSLVAFQIAPVMGAVFMLMLQHPDSVNAASGLAAKARAMQLDASWRSYLAILNQAIGVGGVLVFGFVASWVFGREYADGTAKDLLALPASRTRIIQAKFMVYVAWCLALALFNLLSGLLLSALLQLPGMADGSWLDVLPRYGVTTLLTIAIGTPIAFFALWGKGYLAPLGFVALTLVVAQVIAAAGYGAWFPWAIPGLYSLSGSEPAGSLGPASYWILAILSVGGYAGTLLYWNFADQQG